MLYTSKFLPAGVFLENNFKYQNAHSNEFGGVNSANYAGFFSLSCLLGLMGHFKFKGANPASRRPRNIPASIGLILFMTITNQQYHSVTRARQISFIKRIIQPKNVVVFRESKICILLAW